MLIDFFLHLKERKLPVTTTEYLALLDAIKAGLANCSLDDFYTLSRLCLVKSETNYDKFDRAFGEYFEEISAQGGAKTGRISEEWLAFAAQQLLTPEDLASLAMPETDEISLEERQAQDLRESVEDESQLLVGNSSNSPHGLGALHKESTRLDGESAGNRKAIRAWNSRQYEGLDGDVELGTRNIKMALRRLRKFAREGVPDELDLDETVASTARNAGWLDIRMRPERRNKVKVMLLLDIGGSMDFHIKLCEELFSAARTEFKQLEYFYFHNCIYEAVWRNDSPAVQTHYPLYHLMRKFNKDTRVIVVGDASMGSVEVMEPWASMRHDNSESGAVWMRRLVEHFPKTVWLNPENERFWTYTESIQIIREIFGNRMYPLTLSGLDDAMRVLSR